MPKTSVKTASSMAECRACAAEIAAVLQNDALEASFRPVADFSGCDMFGYIAVVRGPVGMLHASFDQMSRIAREVGLLDEFALDAVGTAVRRFLNAGAPGLLFVPLSPGVIEAKGPDLADELYRLVDGAEGHSGRIALMIPELQRDQLELCSTSMIALRNRGFRLAARSFGCTVAERGLWAQAVPDFVLLEAHQIENVDGSSLRDSTFLDRLNGEISRGAEIVADGVRHSSGFNNLRQLGIKYGAGDFIGRANAVPARAMPAAAHKAIAAARDCSGGEQSAPRGILDRLLTRALPVAPATHAEKVFMLFELNPELRAIAVVEDGRPRGLISRYEMVDNMARPFRHELYGRKPCTRFMDAQPLVVDIGVSLPELSEIVVSADPRHLISGFIITDRGSYLGMGSVQDLVREVTAMQMEAAKYANPLTQLPGNVPINQQIDNQLAAQAACCIAYCDLDHFKPFNDVYGYAKGDEVIQLTARVLTDVCDAELDFVGHIGGDDFVMVMRSDDWESRCKTALEQFGTEILRFFNHEDIERGGYITENRKGELEFHRLTSLSIGAVEAPPGMFQNHLQVSKVAAEVKKRAKSIPGNSLFVNQRSYSNEAPRSDQTVGIEEGMK